MQRSQEFCNKMHLPFPSRLAAWPFLLVALLYGLPISGKFFAHQHIIDQVIFKGEDENTLAYIFVHGGLYLLAIIATWRARSLAFYVFKRQWPLIALTVMVGFSAFWADLPGKAFINFGHNVGVLMVATAAALLYRDEPAVLVQFLGYALCLNIVLNLFSVLAFPQISIDLRGRWRGFTSNPNVLGMISFCGIWAIGMAFFLKGYGKRIVLIGLFLLSAIALIGTQSRTALVCALLVLSVGYVMIHFSSNNLSKYFFIIFFSFIGLAIVLLLILWGNAWESLNPVGLNRLLGRSENYSGRTALWDFALHLISKELWLGLGFDGTAGEIGRFRQLNLHNGFLELAVRGGFTAVLLFAISVCKVIRNLPNVFSGRRSVSAIFFPFVVAFLVYNFTESTIMNPRNISWMIFIFIAFISETQQLPPN